jgi:hypothetical protein
VGYVVVAAAMKDRMGDGLAIVDIKRNKQGIRNMKTTGMKYAIRLQNFQGHSNE